jgi:hypothetical protein
MIALLLALSIVSVASAQTNSVRTNVKAGVEANVPYEQLQAKMVTALDKSIAKVDKALTNISNSKMHPETKVIVTDALEKVKQGLTDYKVKVQATTSYDELETLNAEMKTTTQANSETIKAAFVEAKIVVAENALETFEKFQAEVDKYLDALARACSEQAATIDEIQTQSDELEAGIATLRTAVESGDMTTAKATIRSLGQLSKAIAKDVQTLSQQCSL